MSSRRDCVLVLAFHEHTEQPYDRWFPERRFVFIARKSEQRGFAGCAADVRFLDDYEDPGELRRCLDDIRRAYRITHVLARAERDVIRAAAIRELCGCPGLTIDESLVFRDKHRMYRRIQRAGVPLPGFFTVTSVAEARGLLREHGRIVLKPAYGSGSLGVEIIHEPEALADYFLSYVGEPLLAQVHVEGEMYHIDGIWDGARVGPVFASRYINTCVSFRQAEYLGSHTVSARNAPVDVRKIADDVLATLQVAKPLVFHLEIFVRGRDYCFCEIACRPGGTRVVKTIENHSGINLDRAFAALTLGAGPLPAVPASLTPSGWLVIPPREGRLAAIDVVRGAPWIKELRAAGNIDERLGKARKSGDYIVTYVIEGETEEALVERLRAVGDAVSRSIVIDTE